MKKVIIWLFYFSSSLFIVGCADLVQDKDVSITENPSQGFVAFSSSCEGAAYITMSYYAVDPSIERMLANLRGENKNITVACNKKTPQYTLLNLPAGKYEITSFSTVGVKTQELSPIVFNIEPGKVLYLGRIYVESKAQYPGWRDYYSGNYGYFKIILFNKTKEDIPWVTQTYRNIPSDRYVIFGGNQFKKSVNQ